MFVRPTGISFGHAEPVEAHSNQYFFIDARAGTRPGRRPTLLLRG
jgi:hypothetical protein